MHLVEINEPQVANGYARIQYLFNKIGHFASSNHPISPLDVMVICDTTSSAFQVFRSLEAYRPSYRYEAALMGAEEDFLNLYRCLFELQWPIKQGRQTSHPEDILGRMFIRHMPYTESPCKPLWSEVF